MSEIISFRLNSENPRETQARDVLNAWVNQGFSIRHIITEALLHYDSALSAHQMNETKISSLDDLVNRLENLVDNFSTKIVLDKSSELKEEQALRPEFLGAIKGTIKPGIHL
jgi:hypothetical protein